MKSLLLSLLLSFSLIGASSAGEVETNIKKLNALNSCEECNLKETNFSGVVFGIN
jgi:hypothetical protein